MKHNEMMNAMVELERAINKAHTIAEREFMYTLHKNGYDNESHEWYVAMHLLEAMTKMKCCINIKPE